MLLDFGRWAHLIQGLAALVLGAHVCGSMWVLIRRLDVTQARLLMARGTLAALGLMVPASILRTLGVRTWEEIFALAVLLCLRISLKR
ncbi:MAG: DUF1622 domain-containing protein, partial [Vicinamibacteria bacterium]